MSEQINSQPQQKEIDLIDVTGRIFSGIGRGIKKLSSWLKHIIQAFFRLALKYWWLLLALTILGGTAGYFVAKMQKSYYETEMLIETNVVSRIQIANRINSLQKMIHDRNNTALARQLSLPTNEVKAVFFIKADIVDVRVEGRATRTVRKIDKEGNLFEVQEVELNPQFVRIRVRVWENQGIGRLAQAIVEFVENDSYINEQTFLAKRVNERQQEAIDSEIQQLMLFQKKNIEKSSSVMTPGNSPLMVLNEEKTYVEEILDLKNRLSSLQREYELLRPLTVVQPFTPFENPVDKRLKNILFFALLFFVSGYGFLLFREGWKRI
jgi:hypothetical protein